MGLSGRLCNATGRDVEIRYGRGRIRVPKNSHIELLPSQVDDFRPDKPGSEEVRRMINYHGCFLYDTDTSYDVQVLKAVEAAIKEKSNQFRDFVLSAKNQRIQAGQTNVTEADLEGIIQSAGYDLIRKQIEELENRRTVLKKALGPEINSRSTAPKYDPDRTCFGVTPPKEFSTPLMLELFLMENPEAAEKHKAFLGQVNAAAQATAPVEDTNGSPEV